jgi:hypothetical protein
MSSTSDSEGFDFVKKPISFLLNKRQKTKSDDTDRHPKDGEEEEDSSDNNDDDEPMRECDEYFAGDAIAREYYDSDSESDLAGEYDPETTGPTYQPRNDPNKIPAKEAKPAYNQSGVSDYI